MGGVAITSLVLYMGGANCLKFFKFLILESLDVGGELLIESLSRLDPTYIF